MKKAVTSFLALAVAYSLNAQSPPKEMHYYEQQHQLLMGDQPTDGFYDQSEIKTIYLYFSQPDYWQQMEDNYWSWSDVEILAKMVVDGNVYDSVGVQFKGQSSFQQIDHSQKKSFNISLDFVRPDQKIKGYKKLNLNNAFDDPSFIREIFYETMIKRHVPAAKVSFVRLYLNDEYWGLYVNVQQLNKKFYKEWYITNDGTNWRADRRSGLVTPYGDGTGSLNYLGNDTAAYFEQYIVKSTSVADYWDPLIHTCDVLNNTSLSQLPNELPQVMDVDRTLWFLASEILFSDDDSYIRKGRMDYYVYWEIETGRIVPQEYDGNTVMNPNFAYWSPFYNEENVNYPLMNRLFAVPEYRQRYLAHLRTLLNEYFDPVRSDSVINAYQSQIDALVQGDPKKLYTYNDFINEVAELKSFIQSRRNFIAGNTEVAQQAPLITNVSWSANGQQWEIPAAFQDVSVRASVVANSGVEKVYLYYSNQLVGNFIRIPMFDDGTHNDAAANDGVYGNLIPGQPVGNWTRFYIEAVANNFSKSVSYMPVGAEHDVYAFVTGTTTIKDEENGNLLTISPNPSSGSFLVTMDENIAVSQIEVFDVVGKKIESVKPAQSNVIIDLSDQPRGIYFVQLAVNEKVHVRKVVIQ